MKVSFLLAGVVGLIVGELCTAQPYPKNSEAVLCFGKISKRGRCRQPRGNGAVTTFMACCRTNGRLNGRAYRFVDDNKCRRCPSPVDGQWSPWRPWSFCSALCGGGEKVRSRKCDNPAPLLNGRWCPGTRRGSSTQEERAACNTRPCPVDGGWTGWSNFPPCPVTCGSGEQVSIRSCSNPRPQHGGRPCVGTSRRVQSCVGPPCQTIDKEPQVPSSSKWRPWGPFSPCSRSCGMGSKTRQRTCSVESVNRLECHGPFLETHHCFLRPCETAEAGEISCGGGSRVGSVEGSAAGSGGGRGEGSGAQGSGAQGSGQGGEVGLSDDEDFSVNFARCCQQRSMTYNGNGYCCRRAVHGGCSDGNCDSTSSGDSSSGSGSGSGAEDDEDAASSRIGRSCLRIREARPKSKAAARQLAAAPPAARQRPAAQRVRSRSTRSTDHMDDDYSDDDLLIDNA